MKKAKKKAWIQFSRYIRLKYAKNGFVKCYTCSTVKHWKEMQAGHGIGGRSNAVLFDEDLVRPQCVGCNYFANGRYAVFTQNLINEYGVKKYEEIVRRSNQVVKYTKDDYLEIERKYKELVNELQAGDSLI